MSVPEVAVIGSGPNGLAAALVLAGEGLPVRVYEGADQYGGGLRTAELTLPGFRHDVCAAVHALGSGSPLFSVLGLDQFGLEWVHPELLLAHPFDDGTAAIMTRSVDETAADLGPDAAAYRRLVGPLVRDWPRLSVDILAPLQVPRHPIALGLFGMKALWPARTLANLTFSTPRAKALFAGLAAHSMIPLRRPATAAFGLVLAAGAHAAGFPVARGGSQALADALAAKLRNLGGAVETSHPIASLAELDGAAAVFADVTPRQLLSLGGATLPLGYRRSLESYRYGPGVFKLDWALSEPVPWTAEACRRAVAVHLGGGMDEIALSEEESNQGRHPERPYVIVCQQSLCDATRAPEGKHTLWAYCHVPNGSEEDMTERIEDQIERFAPGFRDCVLARHGFSAMAMERHNPNYVGGDINGGVQDLRQLYFRPVMAAVPYATPVPGLYLCSSSTPPGGGVHGMCGYHAARAALRRELRR